MEELKQALEHRREQGLYRKRLVTQSAQGVRPVIDGKQVLSFCSNDYLGLANHPEIREAFSTAVEKYGVGSGSAHLVNGHSQLHHECEQRLAEFTGRQRALLFSTGYMANLAVTSALVRRQDAVFQDRLNHASLIDAARMVDGKFMRYRHNDLEQLKDLLVRYAGTAECRRLVMTDAVFSMDGDKADLPGLVELCRQTKSWLMIDDAHGIGVLGNKGAGLCEEQGMSQQQVPILMATLGKAVGVSGAFIAGDETLIETLIQQSRSYIFTTASPPATAAAVMKSLEVIQRDQWRRDKLQELTAYLREQVSRLGFKLMDSDTPIQPLIIGDNQKTLNLSAQLFERGIHVTAIRPPTVPEGTARLRITLSADHELSDIDQLVNELQDCWGSRQD